MNGAKITTIGAVVAAIGASLCCIGPAVVALIGVGSIGAFAAFEPFRPYLIGLTAILLGFAFWWTYRKREVQCEDGTCKVQSASKWNKRAVWLATFLATGAIAFPYLPSNAPTAAYPIATAAALPTARVEFRIKGMDCPACAIGLEATLSQREGVRQATVDYERGWATVDYDPQKVTPERLLAVIADAGFEGVMIQKTENQKPAHGN